MFGHPDLSVLVAAAATTFSCGGEIAAKPFMIGSAGVHLHVEIEPETGPFSAECRKFKALRTYPRIIRPC
jgi:hypothetical protein